MCSVLVNESPYESTTDSFRQADLDLVFGSVCQGRYPLVRESKPLIIGHSSSLDETAEWEDSVDFTSTFEHFDEIWFLKLICKYLRNLPSEKARSLPSYMDSSVVVDTIVGYLSYCGAVRWDTVPADLNAALTDLAEVKEEALADGFLEPTEDAVHCAERLLRRSYKFIPQRYEIYPMPEGEVALDPPSGFKQSILFLCRPDGSVHCMLYLNGVHETFTFESEQVLPEQFLRETLLRLQ